MLVQSSHTEPSEISQVIAVVILKTRHKQVNITIYLKLNKAVDNKLRKNHSDIFLLSTLEVVVSTSGVVLSTSGVVVSTSGLVVSTLRLVLSTSGLVVSTLGLVVSTLGLVLSTLELVLSTSVMVVFFESFC